MKKVTFLLLAVLMKTMLLAQEQPKFGLKAGLNVSSTHNTEEGQSGSKAGYHIGLLSHIHLSPEWSLQPEAVFSNQGAEVSGVKLNLNYINIPLLLQYNFNNGFRLQTGPQLGILTGVNSKIDGRQVDAFSTDDFKTVDFSWSVGASYLSYSGFGIDARYNVGLSKINDEPTRGGTTTNRVIQLGVFYLFDHHHKAKSR